MWKKKGMAGLLSLSLLATGLVSVPAQAASSVEWDRNAYAGDRSVTVKIKNARKTDSCQVYTSKDSQYNFDIHGEDTVDKTGTVYKRIRLDGNYELKAGEYIYVEVDGMKTRTIKIRPSSERTDDDRYDRDRDRIYYDGRDWDRGGRFNSDGDIYYDRDDRSHRVYTEGYYVYFKDGSRKIYVDIREARNVPRRYDNYNSSGYYYRGSSSSSRGTNARAPWPPKEMTVSVQTIDRKGSPVVVRFDRDYGMADEDYVVITGLDSAGNTVSTEKKRLSETGLPLAMNLVPQAAVAKYRFTYQGAPGNEAKLMREVNVSGVAADPGFKEATGLSLDYNVTSLTAGAKVAAPKVNVVDANGKKAPYVGAVSFSITGDALANTATSGLGDFTVKADALPGAKVTIRATAGSLSAEKTLSIPALEQLALTSPVTGVSAGKEQTITLQLTAKGQPVNIPWAVKDPKILLTGASDFKAVVKSETFSTDGKAVLSVTGKTPGEQRINVEIRDPEGKVLAISPFTLKVVDPSLPAASKHNVTMNIGASTMIVDGRVVQIDAQPIILQNRTYVPYRALAQAFGAKVDYDNATRSVTTTLGTQKVVMFLDKKTYTVNGQTKTMDVAPFIRNNRTMVPVRFVATGIGFNVTPLYRGNGTVQGVMFGN